MAHPPCAHFAWKILIFGGHSSSACLAVVFEASGGNDTHRNLLSQLFALSTLWGSPSQVTKRPRLDEALAPASAATAGSKTKEGRSRLVLLDKRPRQEGEENEATRQGTRELAEKETREAARDAAGVEVLWQFFEMKARNAQGEAGSSIDVHQVRRGMRMSCSSRGDSTIEVVHSLHSGPTLCCRYARIQGRNLHISETGLRGMETLFHTDVGNHWSGRVERCGNLSASHRLGRKPTLPGGGGGRGGRERRGRR